MDALQERIERMRKMAADNPEDELAHYMLAKHLLEGGQFAEAIPPFCRTLEISPQFSKVYELLATCLIKVDRKPEAIELLQNGWKIADERGDRVPRDAMGKMLKDLGEAIPESTKAAVEDDGPPGDGFQCQRPMCAAGNKARQLARPPLPDEVGKKIYETVCDACWTEWFKGFSIKVINELRIDLSTEFGQEEYDKHMRSFFGWSEGEEVHA